MILITRGNKREEERNYPEEQKGRHKIAWATAKRKEEGPKQKALA